MAKRAKRHTHKYHKQNIGFATVWACALPDCSHYMPEYMSSTVDGKFSICWSCGEQFILNPMNMKRDKPICEECSIPGLKDALEDSDSIKVTEDIVLEPNEDKPFDFAAFLAKPVPMKK